MQSDLFDANPLAIVLNRSRRTGGETIALNARNSAAKPPGFGVPESQFNSVARGKAEGSSRSESSDMPAGASANCGGPLPCRHIL